MLKVDIKVKIWQYEKESDSLLYTSLCRVILINILHETNVLQIPG